MFGEFRMIDRVGGDFCKNLNTTQMAIICSRGVPVHAPPESFEI